MGSGIRHEDEPIPIHRHAQHMPPRPLTRMQPMTTAADTLRTIEMNAERAIVQELRIMIRDVLALRPHLGHEDRDHADVLLLKLDRLARDQWVDNMHRAGAAVALATRPACDTQVASTSRRAAA